MTTHARGSTAPKSAPFTRITNEQISIPKREHSRGLPLGGDAVSKLEFAVLCALMKITFHGQDRCFATNLKIADEAGLTGRDDARRSQIHTALYGRTYRKGRWDPETGKWKRDGELVTLPGLCHPSRGFVEVRQADPSAPRELVLTPRWLEWGRIRVFEGGIGDSRNDGPTPAAETRTAPEIAGPSTDVPAGELAPTPAGNPAPEYSRAVESGNAPEIARSEANAPATAEQPSPDVLAEVLGTHFVNRSREDQAAKFVQAMLSRTILLSLLDDGRIRPTIGAGADPLSPQEIAVLRWLKPELVERLKADAEKAGPRPKPGEPTAVKRPAPKVVNPAEVRAMIKNLTARPAHDDSDCRALARRMVTDPAFAHNDVDPAESEDHYFRAARNTKLGELLQADMIEAFEAACREKVNGEKVRNRGSVFVTVIARKAGMRNPDHQGGPPS